jgi:hypothetical protein
MCQYFGMFAQARNRETEKEPLLVNSSERTFISKQWLGKHIPVAMDMCATIKVLLEMVEMVRGLC